MKVKNLNTYPINLFDADFMRHSIPAGAEYELPDETDVSFFVDSGVMKVITDEVERVPEQVLAQRNGDEDESEEVEEVKARQASISKSTK